MKIWIINHYAVPVKYYPLGRHTFFAQNLIALGHEVKIFAASTVHNSDINLISDDRPYIEEVHDGVPYVLIKCHGYSGNGIKRILNMWEFAWKLKGIIKNNFDKPDAIISCSMTLSACARGISLAKDLGCPVVADITDLWPETIVAYGAATKHHPAVLMLRRLEKWIYKNADAIIFSMEGAYDYIREQHWENIIPESKVYHINNGIALSSFDFNKTHYCIDDDDLNNTFFFKIVYTGSIRRANNLGTLLDAAKLVHNTNARFLIWGDGDELNVLKERVKAENIRNVIFKGKVEKKYIPYIVSKSDVNIAHSASSPILRFGISLNKLFDYFAAGKPIISDYGCKYDPVVINNAGIATKSPCAEDIAASINEILQLTSTERMVYSTNSRKTAEKHDFAVLTTRLLDIIRSCIHEI